MATRTPRKPSETVSWGVFQWVVTGLLGVIALGLGFYFSTLREDIGKLRDGQQDARLELTRAIAAIEKQIAVTNTKLETLIEETRRNRPLPR